MYKPHNIYSNYFQGANPENRFNIFAKNNLNDNSSPSLIGNLNSNNTNKALSRSYSIDS